MCWICTLCRRVLGLPPANPPLDHGMIRLAAEFRARRADEMTELLDSRLRERDAFIEAKEQNVWLRAKRIELEKSMLRQGMELPPDDTD